MNIQIMSDIHFEFYVSTVIGSTEIYSNFIETIDSSGVDILILAGDICSHTKRGKDTNVLAACLEKICALFPHVIYVPGNHEYYGGNAPEIEEHLTAVAESISNLHLLNPGKIEIDGVTFVGATLWFPKPDDKTLNFGKWGMGDYRAIGDFEPWVYDKHAGDVAFIKEHIKEADVVITHHLPSKLSTPERFRGNRLNHFFVCDQEELIWGTQIEDPPQLWVHGHTHDPCDYMIYKTRIVCNPRGYPGEHNKYNDKLVIEVDSETTLSSGT